MRSRLNFAIAALIAVVAVTIWGVLAPGGSDAGASAAPAISYAAPIRPVTPPQLGAGAKLVLDASFEGAALDRSVWATCYPWRDLPTGCNNSANSERQWYLPSQVSVSGGTLNLTAVPADTPGLTRAGRPAMYRCRSGMVTTFPGLRFRYGYVKVVAQLPGGAGLWSAIWLAAADFSWPPELDIIESWGPPRGWASSYFHPRGAATIGAVQHELSWTRLLTGWHTYSLNWTPKQITWFIDDKPVMSVTKHVPDVPMYLIANLADFNMSVRGACSGQMRIRSVQVWQV